MPVTTLDLLHAGPEDLGRRVDVAPVVQERRNRRVTKIIGPDLAVVDAVFVQVRNYLRPLEQPLTPFLCAVRQPPRIAPERPENRPRGVLPDALLGVGTSLRR